MVSGVQPAEASETGAALVEVAAALEHRAARCSMRCAPSAARKPRFLSSPADPDRFTAVTAFLPTARPAEVVVAAVLTAAAGIAALAATKIGSTHETLG